MRTPRKPEINIRARGFSVLNSKAAQLLTATGAQYALICCTDDGGLEIVPVCDEGVVGITRIWPREKGHPGAFLSLGREARESMAPGRHAVAWRQGALEIGPPSGTPGASGAVEELR